MTVKAIITVGISASGKTTWAKEYVKKNKNTINVNRDDLRFSLTGAKDWSEYKFNKANENLITSVQKDIIKHAAEKLKDIIVSDTNLDETRRNELSSWLTSIGYDVEIVKFEITLEEAWKRDALRFNGVGQNVIYRQWKQWLKYIGRRIYVPDQLLSKAIIFDVDGTLAIMGDRTPYEWSKVHLDSINLIIRDMLLGYCDRGYKIIIVSGRDSICKEETSAWLINHGIPHDAFFMRPTLDTRKDTIVKEEILFNRIAPHYNVVAVVDDRPCVVRMWHDIGIANVITVGDQNNEF